MMKLNENLIQLRAEKGLSQEAVAQAVHIKTRTYQNYEYGLPLLPTLIVPADLYDISLDDLVCRERRA